MMIVKGVLLMENSRLQIYKGIIQYILDSTDYTLKNIADLSNSSIKNIRSIYCENLIPHNFSSELHLIRLYQMILEVRVQEKQFNKYLYPKSFRQIHVSRSELQ